MLMTVLLQALSAPARAQTGLNLSWDDCGAAGSATKTFACDVNTGVDVLVASYAASSALCAEYCRGIIDLQASTNTLPDWWQYKNPGSCRLGSLQASADFSTESAGCLDVWQGAAVPGLIAYEVGLGAPNRARITAIAQLVTECQSVPAGVEAGAFKLRIDHGSTVGSGACQGCMDAVCIVFNSLVILQTNDPDVFIDGPLIRNYVTWQSGFLNCPGATTVQNRTWGSIKTLYR